jgi:hypothetical protein
MWLLLTDYVPVINCYKTAQRSPSRQSGITQCKITVLEEFMLACAFLQESVDWSATVETIEQLKSCERTGGILWFVTGVNFEPWSFNEDTIPLRILEQ